LRQDFWGKILIPIDRDVQLLASYLYYVPKCPDAELGEYLESIQSLKISKMLTARIYIIQLCNFCHC
jgi:hypothetical protein